MPKVYSYCVARDYGFAPNPFYGVCTLATCKPIIRRKAAVGDFIVGTGSKGLGQQGKLVYAMSVSEVMSLDEYWADPRFEVKKPNLAGSVKKRFGDNIYHSVNGFWCQEDSHHSHENGTPNVENLQIDTGTDRMLVSEYFTYFGRNAPTIPNQLRNYHGFDLCQQKPGHKCNFPEAFVEEFSNYFMTLPRGYLGSPRNW